MNLSILEQRKQAVLADAHGVLANAKAFGRSTLTPAEKRDYDAALTEARGLTEQIDRYQQIATNPTVARIRTAEAAALGLPAPGALDAAPSTPNRNTMRTNDVGLTYRKHDNQNSYLRDLIMVDQRRDDSGQARERLDRHAAEVGQSPVFDRPEYRSAIGGLSRVDGQGGFFVPPAWLVDEWITYARPGRTFANLISQHPLPGGTDSINVPKILTGTATGIQTADLQPVAETDLTDTYITSAVRTISGQQSVALQLIDQSPISFDDVVLTDLAAAQAVTVDQQCLYGTGTSGQILGLANWPGITSIACSDPNTIQGIYGSLANAINLIWTQRFAAPTAIVMHPRRWAALLAMLDANNRPLFLPEGNNPMNAAGIMANVEPQNLVGRALGLPIFTDAVITTTNGNESPVGDEDVIYVLRAQDVVLYESGVRARVLPEPLAANLAVLIQLYSYLAFAVRYPASVVEISGLTPPAFG